MTTMGAKHYYKIMPGPLPFHRLTWMEQMVIKLLCQGLTLEQAAKQMHINYKTAYTYKVRAKEKMCIESDLLLGIYIGTNGLQ